MANVANMVLEAVLRRMIERGDTATLRVKIDVLFAVGRLDEAAYTELCERLPMTEASEQPESET